MHDTQNNITDLTYLVEISKGNKVFVDEMISIFLTENPMELKDLEAAIFKNDFAQMKEAAHKMKSTIPFIGLDKLIEQDLEEIEHLSLERSHLEKIKILFSKIKSTCLKATEELKTQYKQDMH